MEAGNRLASQSHQAEQLSGDSTVVAPRSPPQQLIEGHEPTATIDPARYIHAPTDWLLDSTRGHHRIDRFQLPQT